MKTAGRKGSQHMSVNMKKTHDKMKEGKMEFQRISEIGIMSID